MNGWCNECGRPLINDAGAVIYKDGRPVGMLCLDCAEKDDAQQEQKQKHGRWLAWRSMGMITFECSVCGNVIDVEYEDFDNGDFAFCDKCGAQMEKPVRGVFESFIDHITGQGGDK